MRQGSVLIVSSGMGTYKCFFLEWIDCAKMRCINRLGREIVVSQFDVIEMFI